MNLVKLGDILKLEYGKPLPEADRSVNGLYPAYGANGIKVRTDKYFFENPSIIVGRKGSAGELTFTEGKFWPLDVTYYVVHDQSKTDLKYIYYLLKNVDLPSMAKGVKPGINRNDVYSVLIDLPSLTEQERIVAKIEALFDQIGRTSKLIGEQRNHAQDLFNSYLESIFKDESGGEDVKIEEVCSIKGGKRLPKGEKLTKQKTSYPYIRVTDFDHLGSVDVDSVQYLEKSIQSQISNYIVTDEDVFLSIAGSIGITGIVPSVLSGANLTENACRMIPNDSIDKEYLYYFTLTKSFIHQAAGATRQTAQPKLALTRVKNIRLYLPGRAEQAHRVLRLKSLSRKVNTIRDLTDKEIIHLEALKASVLTNTFMIMR